MAAIINSETTVSGMESLSSTDYFGYSICFRSLILGAICTMASHTSTTRMHFPLSFVMKLVPIDLLIYRGIKKSE